MKKTPDSKIIMVDLDNIILDFISMFITTVNAKYNTEITIDDILSFDIYNTIGFYDPSLIEEVVFQNLELIDGMDYALKILRDMGAEIHIVTSRWGAIDHTLQNLDAVGITEDLYHKIFFNQGDKSDYIKRHQPTIMIEDRLRNALKAKYTKEDLHLLVRRYPYNSKTLNLRGDIEFFDNSGEMLIKCLKILE